MTWDEQAMQEIKDIDERKSTNQRAAVKLGVNIKTVERKLRAYRQHGMSCFTHKNTGKAPANKIDFDSIIEFVRSHDLTGCNFTELSRLLCEYGNIQVSSSCLRKRFYLNGVLSVKCKRRTRKKLKKVLREMRDREEAIPQQKREILSALEQEEITGAWHHPTKPRSKYFGERLEMDACSYVWIQGLGRCTLHVCIDDASGYLVGLWLEHEETLNGYYKLMEQVLTTHGIPLKLRTDKRSVFIYNKKGGGMPEHDTLTQFAYACRCLGITLSCNSDPDFKPKVERAHQTLQGILPFRFIMEEITSIEQANEYLQSTYMALFNRQFGYAVDYVDGKERPIESVFVPCSAEDIHKTLAVLCERAVNKGSTIQLNNIYMALLNDQGKRVALPYHTKVTVARLLDGSLYAAHAKHCYALEPVPQRHAFSPEVDHAQEKPKPVRPKVPQSHPWSFTKQMKFKQHDALMKKLAPCYKSPNESRIA